MRVIVAGSRGFTLEDYEVVENTCLMSGYWFSTILCGLADGVDRLGEEFAKRMDIPVKYYPADWARFGERAEIMRNESMAKEGDALVAVWNGKSPRTEHMIRTARAHGLLVHVRIAEPTPLMPISNQRGP